MSLLQANITILNVQQASDPIVNVAEPLTDGDEPGGRSVAFCDPSLL